MHLVNSNDATSDLCIARSLLAVLPGLLLRHTKPFSKANYQDIENRVSVRSRLIGEGARICCMKFGVSTTGVNAKLSRAASLAHMA